MAVNLGRVGTWLGGLSWQPASSTREVAAEVEELGYGALWIGETPIAKEAFTHSAILLAATSRIPIATGIVNVWLHTPVSAAHAGTTLAEAYPGRFVLGIGISHHMVVEGLGQTYDRPVTRMREYLDAMDEAQWQAPEPAEPVTLVLAALRPRMLALSAERTHGAHPYFVPVEHTRRARELLGKDSLLLPEQAVLLETDPERAREVAREHTSFYLSAPNYRENLRWLGFEDEDFEGGGSDRLVDAVVAWGDEDAVVARVRDHLEAGADHVCIQPLAPRGQVDVEPLRRLAPALLEL